MKTIIIFIALCIPFFALTVWAVADVAQKDFGSPGRKVLWWLIASVPFVGALVYLALGFRKGTKIV